MYNLIECSYGQFRKFIGFQRDEIANNANITNHDNAPSFKTKVNLIVNSEKNGIKKGVKTAVSLKYISNCWRSLEMLLINYEADFSL